MKLLKDILYKVSLEDVIGNTHLAIEQVCFDNRKIEKLAVFVAVKGVQTDGHLYIDHAVEAGAAAVVCEVLPTELKDGVTYIKVKKSHEALGIIASNFYDNPSEKLKLVGITGTNGKTTTVTLLAQLFKRLGYKTGLISTVVNMIAGREVKATHTTPDPVQLNALMADMVAEGCSHCFMEVSSHAIHQHRIAGLAFDGAVFTNISHDHLDYHKTFNDYIKAKKAFFDGLSSSAFSLYNKDDIHGEVMVQNTSSKQYSFAMRTQADFKVKILESHFHGMQLLMDDTEVWTKLIGRFNAYNLAVAYGVALLLGEDRLEVLTMLSNLDSVRGRFQYVRSANGIIAVVDYAHTPDALKNVLSTIADIRGGAEQVITVVGCGGDRDKSKRPMMAAIACNHSDRVLLTSDNPRTESPEQIIKDMEGGIDTTMQKKVLSITDRREAIKAAVSFSQPGDIILVAGKGHENYQEINGERFHFDDMEVLTEMLKMVS